MLKLFFIFIAAHGLAADRLNPLPALAAASELSIHPSGGAAAAEGFMGGHSEQPAARYTHEPIKFSQLAPLQKRLGLIQAISHLRVKISVLEQAYTSFEPEGKTRLGNKPIQLPPGPILAYLDCKLGIVGLEVCRHLGFLAIDPVVPPSSLQAQMLVLREARAVVRAFTAGELNLLHDEDLAKVMTPQQTQLAVRALGSCWNAQLLLPSFEARQPSSPALDAARSDSDAFLLHNVMNPKRIPAGLQLGAAEGDELAWMVATLPRADILAVREAGSGPAVGTPQLYFDQRQDLGFFADFFNRILAPRGDTPSPETAAVEAPKSTTAPTQPASMISAAIGGLASAVASNVGTQLGVDNYAAEDELDHKISKVIDRLPDEVHGQF